MTDTQTQTREAVQSALAQCARADSAAEAAKILLHTLGYKSERTHHAFANVQQFIADFPAPQLGARTEEKFIKTARAAQIVFQYTKDDIAAAEQLLNKKFARGNAESFLFFAVELKPHAKDDHPRGDYAAFAREINKRFGMPAVVLFRVKQTARLTLAFVGRRTHKKDSARDVLQKVSLLRGIQCDNPHRGHADILANLSLPARLQWMQDNKKEQNFDGLLAAWLDELNADALNKRFYKELFDWFERAREPENGIQFPPNLREKREDWIIRLITRLLFVWFIKEKNLVAEELFTPAQIRPLLKHGANKDSYYRVVLQNLFFATLNTPLHERKFSPGGTKIHRNFSLRRYENEIAAGRKNDLCKLFAQTPFINGGLFDCLDDYDSPTSARNAGRKNGGIRIDYFSDTDGKKLSLPDKLFFDDKGLLEIFRRYKFTVEENTPVEQEVALDPELLGRVFENLLACYNPETRETARKQTGSFYTPREIVDYMTRESLAECLAAKTNADKNTTRDLLDYAKPAQNISAAQTKALVRAVSEIKIFDPAAGSGAFPMGVLNLLTLALGKLDPKNKEWRALQKQRAQQDAAAAFDGNETKTRNQRLAEISDTFDRYSTGFGRKLFLIQNSIFGADIQPVACQIAKLRFFISLAIEQTPDNAAENFGIKPLPNLETRFVAADTLAKIGGKGQAILKSDAISRLESQLAANRERHFNATARKDKLQCRARDSQLRQQLAAALAKNGFVNANAQKIAQWNPYDQNAAAEWFDAEYMFGIADGFDIVIGNPPYVMVRNLPNAYKNILRSQNFASFHGIGDMYMLFYEKGLQLCRPCGMLSFITSNTWMRSDSGAGLRRVLARHNPRFLINMGESVFDNVAVSTNILFTQAAANKNELRAVDLARNADFPPSDWIPIAPKDNWVIAPKIEQNIAAKIEAAGIPIAEWDSSVYVGIFTGYNEAFIIDTPTKRRIIAKYPKSAKVIQPTLQGKNIDRYCCASDNWVIVIPKGWTDENRGAKDPEDFFRAIYPGIYEHLTRFAHIPAKGKGLYDRDNQGDYWWELRACSYYAAFDNPKLVWSDIATKGQFAYDSKKFYPQSGVYAMVGADIEYLLAVLNSRLITWHMPNVAVNLGDSGLRWRKAYVEKLPVPQISKAEQRPFIQLAQKITAAKAANPAADTKEWEAEIDRRVYKLYNLTKEEIAAIESANQPPPQK